VKGGFRLRNVNIIGFFFYYLFDCYNFRSYDHLQAEIYIFARNYSTDHGSIVFRLLVIMNDYTDRFDC
jgi:hypothetical protein